MSTEHLLEIRQRFVECMSATLRRSSPDRLDRWAAEAAALQGGLADVLRHLVDAERERRQRQVVQA